MVMGIPANIMDIFNMRWLTDAVFPPKCLKCGTFLIVEDALQVDQLSQYFCQSCFKIQEGCNTATASNQYSFNTDVSHNFKSDIDHLSYCPIDVKASSNYDGIIKESIHLLKYNGKTALADPLGLLLFHIFIRYYANKPVDFIVPIPLYRWRLMKRGFNQSFLLVRNFRKYWLQWKGICPAWQIAPDILVRQRNTKSQTGFNREERRENIRGAFAVRKKDVVKKRLKGKHIVIVDDVHTTGATTTEAGKTLLEAGASSVGVIVLARA